MILLSNLVVHIFVDGSSHPTKGQAYGFVVMDSRQTCIIHQEQATMFNADYKQSTNCAAEIMSAIKAVQWAERHGYKYINIHHDYSGLNTLARHQHDGHRYPLFDFYKQLIRRRLNYRTKTGVKVFLRKVKAHRGTLGNEIADRLARAGLLHNHSPSWISLLSKWTSIAKHSLFYMKTEELFLGFKRYMEVTHA